MCTAHSRWGESLFFPKAVQSFEQADLLQLLFRFAALFSRQLALVVCDDQPLLFSAFGDKQLPNDNRWIKQEKRAEHDKNQEYPCGAPGFGQNHIHQSADKGQPMRCENSANHLFVRPASLRNIFSVERGVVFAHQPFPFADFTEHTQQSPNIPQRKPHKILHSALFTAFFTSLEEIHTRRCFYIPDVLLDF